MKRRLLRVFIITLIIWNCLFIVVNAAENVYEEDEVVVTASRTEQPQSEAPGHTEVITKDDIEKSGSSQGSVADVLIENGINVSQYSSTGTANVQVDGAKTEQTLIMINGIPANTGTLGQVDLSCYLASGVERIEIAHGPLSALYGGNALGGVVNIITDLTGKAQEKVAIAGGSFETGKFNYTSIHDKWGLAIGSNATQGDRERSGAYNNFFNAQYNFYETERNYLKLYVNASKKNAQIPGSLQIPSIQADQEDENYQIHLSGKEQILNGIWEYKVYSQLWDEQYQEYTEDHYRITNYGTDLAGLYNVGNQEIITGLATKRSFIHSSQAGDRTQNDWGVFAQDTWKLADNLRLVGGVRRDFSTKYNSPVTPRVALIHNVTNNLTLKYGYGESFRVPTVNELYYQGVDNSDLKPEKGKRFDVNAEIRQGASAWTVNVFRNRLEDGIEWVNIASQSKASNVAQSRTQGVVLGWKRNWSESFTQGISYQIIDREDDKNNTGNYQANNLFGRQNLNLTFGVSKPKYDLNVNYRYIIDRTNQTKFFADWSSKEVKMPDYGVANLNWRYRFHSNFNMNLNIANITDEKYEVHTDYPMPGRSGLLTLNYTF